MATVAQYIAGEVARAVRQAYDIMAEMKGDPAQHPLGSRIIANVQKLKPRILSQAQATALIQEAQIRALGERVCRCRFAGSPLSQSVFLDELAAGLIQAGQAQPVSAQEALAALARYPDQPLVASLVSGGGYQEICRTWPDSCVYWNLERRGVSCLRRPSQEE